MLSFGLRVKGKGFRRVQGLGAQSLGFRVSGVGCWFSPLCSGFPCFGVCRGAGAEGKWPCTAEPLSVQFFVKPYEAYKPYKH